MKRILVPVDGSPASRVLQQIIENLDSNPCDIN